MTASPTSTGLGVPGACSEPPGRVTGTSAVRARVCPCPDAALKGGTLLPALGLLPLHPQTRGGGDTSGGLSDPHTSSSREAWSKLVRTQTSRDQPGSQPRGGSNMAERTSAERGWGVAVSTAGHGSETGRRRSHRGKRTHRKKTQKEELFDRFSQDEGSFQWFPA